MKIGDRVFVCGYLDEIRKDTIIIRNDGGYFGTIPSEVMGELPSAQPDKRLEKIADLVEGTINHFDRDDAMDLLYQIKEVLNEK